MKADAKKVRSLFLKAVEGHVPEEWDAFLDRACDGDADLKRQVEVLLQAHEQPNSLLDAPAPALVGTVDERSLPEGPGTVIGPYRLLGLLGEGGMGLVFAAEQRQPVRRRVALKVIKPGMDSKAVVARFEQERQALALMDHPNIAKVLDGGTTPSGRPYFVMELVRGTAITEFCDGHRLATRDRLNLMTSVCQAVQHAHQKGIIHRDLKPSNVMVAAGDGTPTVKVIDFGVAKAVGQALIDKTVYTQASQVVGTPLYMSPEQAGLGGLDVDTRTDVYALGVLLYELLTGTTPFDPERLAKVDFDEVRRIIREEEPVKPSTRFSTLTGSANRRGDAKVLCRLVRGELDWIVMKALEKDRERRYESASALAADIQRYLNDEPVLAGPPSVGYRLSKFVKRHRGPVLAAAAVLLVLVAGIVGTAAGLVDAVNARNAEAFQRGQAEANAVKAGEAAARATEAAAKATAEWGRAEGLLYASQLTLAQHAWEANDARLAFHYLGKCRPDRRGWEHDYLFTLFTSGQRTIRGHTAGVVGLAVCPDGKRIVSSGSDKTVRVWEVETGQVLLTLKGPPDSSDATTVTRLAYSPDGRRIATANVGGTVRLWDAATGEEVRSIVAHVGKLSAWTSDVAWSPDGKRLVSCGWDGAVKVWDAETGKEVQTLQVPGSSVYSVAWSRDGRRVAAGDNDGWVKVWDAATGQLLRVNKGHQLNVNHVAWSFDSKRIASSGYDQTVRIWDAETGEELRALRGHSKPVRSVVWSPDGRRVVTGSEDQSVKVWDVDAGTEPRTLRGHEGGVWSVALMPDGQTVVSTSSDQTVKVWGPAGPELFPPTTPTGLRLSIRRLAASRDGRRIVTIGTDGKIGVAATEYTVKVWNTTPGTPPRVLRGHTNLIACVDVSADGRRVASGGHDQTVKIWDEEAGNQPRTLRGFPSVVTALALSADGRRLVTGSNTKVTVWDADSGTEIVTRSQLFSLNCLTLSPDGRRVVSDEGNGTLTVWDADTGRDRLTISGHFNSVLDVAWSVDGQRIVTAGFDQTVKVWDADTGKPVRTLQGHTAPVSCVVVMPDGRRIASAGHDQTVKVWDAESGQELLTLRGHPNFVSSLAVSHDGKRLFSTSNDQVKVWDASMSQPKP